MEIVFWLSILGIAYVYVGYPVLLAAMTTLRARPVRKHPVEPTVSIVIAAYNEVERIERKIRNCLILDYPREKLEIIISSDGSTDGTSEVVHRFSPYGIVSVCSRSHRGKPAALNRAVRQATGEIVVFADVRQAFKKDAIRQLVANFADPDVGAVSGQLILLDETLKESQSEVGVYWKYEKCIRSLESRLHSVVGATGAIYAIRRELYRTIPNETLLDDVVIPMRIVMNGRRVVFEPDARAYDIASCCPRAEFGRKVRTLTGNYQLLAQMPEVLSPLRNPLFWQFVSHKIGRLAVPHLLVALLLSNMFLLGGWYTVFFIGQCAGYACAAAGYGMAAHQTVEPVLRAEEQRRAA